MEITMKEERYPIAELPFFMNTVTGEGLLLSPLFYHASRLLCVRRGHVTLTVGTRYTEGHAGDIFYLPPDTAVSLRADGQASVREAVFRTEELLSDLSEFERELLKIYKIVYTHRPAVYSGASRTACALSAVMERLYDEWQAREVCFRLSIRAAVYEAMAVILRDFADANYTEERTAYKNILRLSPAISYIGAHYMERLYVAPLAEMTLLSPDHFEKLFREALGFSPIEFVFHVRMNRALCRLLATEESITRLARASGFSSSTYFIKSFASDMGMSPYEFRSLMTHTEEES